MRKSLYYKLAVLFTAALCSCENRPENSDAYTRSIATRIEEANRLSDGGQKEKAAQIYKQIITIIPDSTDYAKCQPLVIEALQQLSNDAVRLKEPIKWAEWCQMLADSPTSLIHKYCLRDLYTATAIQWYQCDSLKRAQQYILKALDTQMQVPSPERYYRDFVNAARYFVQEPSMRQNVIDWLELALKNAYACKENPKDIGYTHALLGTLYNWEGQIDKAFSILSVSYSQAVEANDTIAQIYALNTLSNLHMFWNLYDEARNFSARAVELAEASINSSSTLLCDTYMLKAHALEEVYPDSMPIYLIKAGEIIKDRPYNQGRDDVDYQLATYYFQYSHDYETAKKHLYKFLSGAFPIKKHSAYFMMARIYFEEGNEKMVEQMLDSMYYYTHYIGNIPTRQRHAMEYGLKYYVTKGNTEKIVQYAKDITESDFYDENQKIKGQMVNAIINFRTSKAEDQVMQLELEQKLQKARIGIISTLSISIILLLILIIIFMILKRRWQQKHEEALKLNKLLNTKLTEATIEAQTNKEGLNKFLNDANNRRISERMSVALIKESGEAEFRNRFHILYPEFEKQLKNLGVKIGTREEIMCMLFILGLDSQEVAQTLFIARQSVNVARYRLRKKLKLTEDTNLDDFLIKLVNKDAKKEAHPHIDDNENNEVSKNIKQ